MNLTEQICTQALLLSRDVEDEDHALLRVLCRAAEVSLLGKLREGVSPADCKADFIAAASMYALAALSDMDEMKAMEQIQAGDLTLRRASDNAAACCLRYQAELIMMPYLKDNFVFTGV